jgi:hypothetical protein
MNDLAAADVVAVAVKAAGYERDRPTGVRKPRRSAGGGLRGCGRGAEPKSRQKNGDYTPRCLHPCVSLPQLSLNDRLRLTEQERFAGPMALTATDVAFGSHPLEPNSARPSSSTKASIARTGLSSSIQFTGHAGNSVAFGDVRCHVCCSQKADIAHALR